MKVILCLVTIIITAIAVPPVVGDDPWIPATATWNENFTALHESYLNTTRTLGANINVIFYGDSITDWWAIEGKSVWDQTYAPLGAVNYGISGDMTQNVLWRIINGEVVGLNPKLVILKIGTNNLGYASIPEFPENYSVGDTARGAMSVVRELRVRLPQTKILLLGILPCFDAQHTERREEVNEYLSLLDNGVTIRFLNMRDSFYAGNGSLYTELYKDELHLTEAGYRKWNETMWDLFQEMLNSDSGNTNSSSGLMSTNIFVIFLMIAYFIST